MRELAAQWSSLQIQIAAAETALDKLPAGYARSLVELRAREGRGWPGSPALAALRKANSLDVAEAEAEAKRLGDQLNALEEDIRNSLPALSDDILALIASHLGIPDLFRLAQALPCTPMSHKDADGGKALWTVAEEGARLQLVAHGRQVMGWAPWHSGRSWFRSLHKAQQLLRPLKFTSLGPNVRSFKAGNVVCSSNADPNVIRPAVCDGAELTHGQHYAVFTIYRPAALGNLEDSEQLGVGVVGAGFDSSQSQGALESRAAWMLDTSNGDLDHGYERDGDSGPPLHYLALSELKSCNA